MDGDQSFNKNTNDNTCNQSDNKTLQMEYQLLCMDVKEDKEEKDLCGGYFLNTLPNIKINKDVCGLEEMLNDIDLSSDEDDNVDVDDGCNKKKNIYDEDDEPVNTYMKTKNEIEEYHSFPDKISIKEFHQIGIIGLIFNIDSIKRTLTVKSNTKNIILDLDNLIFNTNNLCIGFIDDLIGKIEEPYYIIKLYPDINISIFQLNEELFFIQNQCKYIDNIKTLLIQKGCDASNAFDEEIKGEEIDFSDDEEEKQHKNHKKIKQKINKELEDIKKKYIDSSFKLQQVNPFGL
jgi:H/ACA ribonucleoprotein complex non-core subunit NAF1